MGPEIIIRSGFYPDLGLQYYTIYEYLTTGTCVIAPIA